MQITTVTSSTDTARVEFFTHSNPSTDYRVYGVQANTPAEAIAAVNLLCSDWVIADLYIGESRRQTIAQDRQVATRLMDAYGITL